MLRFACVLGLLLINAVRADGPMKFDFADEKTVSQVYSVESGHGFDLSTKPMAGAGCITADSPFYFSVKVPDGNYRVTVVFGDDKIASINTVKAESRRLMLQNIATKPGEIVTRSFVVNVRTPNYEGGRVKLKDREKPYLHWDDKLTLEFNGKHPAIRSLEVAKADDVLTVYLLGDSTVTDQPNEPWNSWGQMITRFFKDDVAVANNAESGESLKSSRGANRLAKVLSSLKQGDYVFIQFGHNDMKDKSPGFAAMTGYKEGLEAYVKDIQAKGGKPVLVTSMHRRSFEKDGKVKNTLQDYPDAVRLVAKEKNLPLIDLNEMSKAFYEALGPDGSKVAFQDGTHHNNYGSYELARCIVEGIRMSIPELAAHLSDDAAIFDPSKPDPVGEFDVSPSPAAPSTKPDGN